jgi:hypothetical protein
MNFGRLLNINKDDTKNKLFVSTDIDWANDSVLGNVADFFDSFKAKVTWFCTHDTIFHERLRDQNNFDLGIHPNFNMLLNGDSNSDDYKMLIDRMMKLIPEAKIARSHSVTCNSLILDYLTDKGIEIDSNIFIPFDTDMKGKPFTIYNGLTRAPYIWSDDIHLYSNWKIEEVIEGIKDYDGLRLIDCHPIHIFLNTPNIDLYNDARPYLKDYKLLKKFVNTDKPGVRDYITQILDLAK